MTVQMSVGGPLTASGPAVVADAALTATANAQTGWVGQPLGMVFGQGTSPVTLATFTDADPAGTVSDYSASIAWGDGITSAAVVSLGTGNFKAQSNHTYVQPGSYTITTTITDAGGVATIVQATATVGIREGLPSPTPRSTPVPPKPVGDGGRESKSH